MSHPGREKISKTKEIRDPYRNTKLGNWSRTLKAAEKNHDTMNHKAIAVEWASLVVRHFLEQQKLKTCTDLHAHKWIRSLKVSKEQLAKWISVYPNCTFMVHKVRIKNQAPNALLRLEIEGTEKPLLDIDIGELIVSFVQHLDLCNEEKDSSSADKYCACQNCDVNVKKQQKPSIKVAAIVKVK